MIVVIADIWLSIGTTARDVTILLASSELGALALNFYGPLQQRPILSCESRELTAGKSKRNVWFMFIRLEESIISTARRG
jgi:hypothetical protein